MRNGFPFRCRHCHEYGHLGRNCPKGIPRPDPTALAPPKAVEEDGFTQVKNRRCGKGGGKSLVRLESMPNEKIQGNSFEDLGSLKEGEEIQAMPMAEDQQEGPSKAPVEEEAQ